MIPSRLLTLAAALALVAGCGGTPSEVDTAETVRPEPSKPAPAPEVPPAKDAPK